MVFAKSHIKRSNVHHSTTTYVARLCFVRVLASKKVEICSQISTQLSEATQPKSEKQRQGFNGFLSGPT